MAEKWVLTTPQSVGPTAIEYRVVLVEKIREPDWSIRVIVKDQLDRVTEIIRSGAEAQGLIITLNKSNNATTSEERRIINYLVAEGELEAGTFSGAPD